MCADLDNRGARTRARRQISQLVRVNFPGLREGQASSAKTIECLREVGTVVLRGAQARERRAPGRAHRSSSALLALVGRPPAVSARQERHSSERLSPASCPATHTRGPSGERATGQFIRNAARRNRACHSVRERWSDASLDEARVEAFVNAEDKYEAAMAPLKYS